MTVRPPYDLSMFKSAGVYVSCCILFYTLKMSSCTCLVQKIKNRKPIDTWYDHTIPVRVPHWDNVKEILDGHFGKNT